MPTAEELLYKGKVGVITCGPFEGVSIQAVVQHMIDLAKEHREPSWTTLNGVEITAMPDDKAEDLLDMYDKALRKKYAVPH